MPIVCDVPSSVELPSDIWSKCTQYANATYKFLVSRNLFGDKELTTLYMLTAWLLPLQPYTFTAHNKENSVISHIITDSLKV